MLDVQKVSFSVLWIAALVLALSVTSWSLWYALESRQAISIILSGKNQRRVFNIAGLLFCVGLTGIHAEIENGILQMVVWMVLAMVFIALLIFDK